MAGDWFPLQLWRSKCPEIVRVSSTTGRTRHEVLGLLCDFWSWASSESADGRVRGVRVQNLPDAVGADAAFWEAVVSVGWLVEGADGIAIPGWDTWLSESAKKRHKDRVRKRSERAVGQAKPRPKSVRDLSEKCPRSVRDLSAKCPPTERDTEEKKKNPPKPPDGGLAVKPPKPRDDLFDAVAEVTGSDPKASGPHVAKVRHALARADPPYTAAEVREFGRRFGEFCPWGPDGGRGRPTLGEVEKYIGQLRAKPPPPQALPAGRSRGAAQDNYAVGVLFNAIGKEGEGEIRL